MWISLAESDNKAHQNDLLGYQSMLRLYDDFLVQVFESVKQLGLADKTLIIVTTDHGRGNGDNWTSHGPNYPESKQTWAFVWHGKLEPIAKSGDITRYSTLSIRPTIERIFFNNNIA
jgi:arylsulfatase A-like enzyme